MTTLISTTFSFPAIQRFFTWQFKTMRYLLLHENGGVILLFFSILRGNRLPAFPDKAPHLS